MAKDNFFKSREVLITGGLGFIGSNLAIKLVELGAKVTIVDAILANFGGNKFNIWPVARSVTVVTGDIRNQKLVNRLVVGNSIIFNLAGTLSHIDSMTDPFLDLDINCRAQLCLLEACRKFNKSVKIIYSGTRNQYGRALYLPIDEKHIQEPTDINGINSIAAEKYHLLYGEIYGIDVVSLRMTNTYGPRHQMKHPKQGVLNWFIRQLLSGQVVNLFGDGSQIRDVNYVDDVVRALLLVAKSRKTTDQVYNLGGAPITLKEFVAKAIEILGHGEFKLVPFPKERKAIEIGNYVADIKKIREEVGWEPKVNLDVGLTKTIEYYKKYKKHYF